MPDNDKLITLDNLGTFKDNIEEEIDSKQDALTFNPTVPSGTTPTALTGLKVGLGSSSTYYSLGGGGTEIVTLDFSSVGIGGGGSIPITQAQYELFTDATKEVVIKDNLGHFYRKVYSHLTSAVASFQSVQQNNLGKDVIYEIFIAGGSNSYYAETQTYAIENKQIEFALADVIAQSPNIEIGLTQENREKLDGSFTAYSINNGLVFFDFTSLGASEENGWGIWQYDANPAFIITHNGYDIILTIDDTYSSGDYVAKLVLTKFTHQEELESGTNIKTVNGVSLLGSGNIEISGSGSGLPTIAVTQSQVVSQDPMQVQLTDEQYTAMNERSVIFDGTALGMTTVVADYIGSSTDDNDVRYLKFAFVYSEDSYYLYFHTIFVNTSTKVAELQFNNTFPAKADHAYSASVDKSDIGLGNVDNTSDMNKPISTATQTALNLKADKATTYTKDEVNNLISGLSSLSFSVVSELPATGSSDVIYLVPNSGSAPDIYDEYVWLSTSQAYERLGSTDIDLSGYLKILAGNLAYQQDTTAFRIWNGESGYITLKPSSGSDKSFIFLSNATNSNNKAYFTTDGIKYTVDVGANWTTLTFSNIETKTNTANTYAKKADVYTKAEVDSAIATAVTGAINASY